MNCQSYLVCCCTFVESTRTSNSGPEQSKRVMESLMQELSEAAKLAKWPSFSTTRDCLQTLAIKKRIRIGRNIRDYISFFALVAGIETGSSSDMRN